MFVTFPAAVFLASMLLSPPPLLCGAVTAAAGQQAPPKAASKAQEPQKDEPEAAAEARKKEAHRKSMEVGRLIERRDFKQAEALAREAVAADPENPETHYALGLCFEATGKLDDAVAEYQKMGIYAPEPLLELSLARVYLRQGKLDEAEKQARKAVEKNRWVPQPHLTLGAVAMRKRDYKTAIESFTAAIDADPQDWNARISLGDACRAVSRFDEALTQYAQALALKPGHPEALLGRAQAWEQLGRSKEAIDAYEKLLAVSPGNTFAAYHLARLYNQVADPALQKPQRAIELAVRAAEATNWRDAQVMGTLAYAYERAGFADKAQEVRKRAAALSGK